MKVRYYPLVFIMSYTIKGKAASATVLLTAHRGPKERRKKSVPTGVSSHPLGNICPELNPKMKILECFN